MSDVLRFPHNDPEVHSPYDPDEVVTDVHFQITRSGRGRRVIEGEVKPVQVHRLSAMMGETQIEMLELERASRQAEDDRMHNRN